MSECNHLIVALCAICICCVARGSIIPGFHVFGAKKTVYSLPLKRSLPSRDRPDVVDLHLWNKKNVTFLNRTKELDSREMLNDFIGQSFSFIEEDYFKTSNTVDFAGYHTNHLPRETLEPFIVNSQESLKKNGSGNETLRRGSHSSSSLSIPLQNIRNVQYVGTVYLGTPPQRLNLIFDTGSSDLWVASDSCSINQSQCYTRQSFNASQSSSFVLDNATKNVSITYGKGIVRGKMARDTLTLGPLNFPYQQFLIADQEEGLQGAEFDGVLGLGPLNDSTSFTSVVQRLSAVKDFQTLGFMLRLSRNENESFFHLLFLNRKSKKFLKNFTWVPTLLDYPSWWTLAAQIQAKPNHKHLVETTKDVVEDDHDDPNDDEKIYTPVIIDSGTSFIVVPQSSYKLLISRVIPIGARKFCWVHSSDSTLQFPCSVSTYFKSIQLTFSTMTSPYERHSLKHQRKSKTSTPFTVTLSPAKYVTQLNTSRENPSASTTEERKNASNLHTLSASLDSVCRLEIIEGSDDVPWILGDTFLQNVDALFVPRVAQSLVGFRLRNSQEGLEEGSDLMKQDDDFIQLVQRSDISSIIVFSFVTILFIIFLGVLFCLVDHVYPIKRCIPSINSMLLSPLLPKDQSSTLSTKTGDIWTPEEFK